MGRWKQAVKELEAFRELTDSTEQHPVLADCYRALHQYAKSGFSKKPVEAFAAQRRYLARMAEYLFYDIPPVDAQRKQAVLEFYAWLQLSIARSAGTLLPFEGIRLVREPVGPEGVGKPPGGNFNWLGTS